MTDNTAAIKALVKAQAEMTGAIKSETNPHFRQKYAGLGAVQDACLPALHKHGFAVIHAIGRDDGGAWLETSLLHESGEEPFSCRVPLRVDKDNMQGLGSAITYARRYGLMCISGVAPEDDDGNNAAASPPKRGNGQAREAPQPTEEAAQKVVSTIKNIWGEAELVGFWTGLKDEQPGMQKAPGVAEAKDAQKVAIAYAKTDEEENAA